MNDLIVAIIVVGAVAVAVPLLAGAVWLWWVTIPIVCALALGWIGFFFGVGVDVVLGVIVLFFKGLNKEMFSNWRRRPLKRPLQVTKTQPQTIPPAPANKL